MLKHDGKEYEEFLHICMTESGEGNGTPLQYSCLENPMDGGAWWAAVHGVAKSRTQLKRLSSSSRRLVTSRTRLVQSVAVISDQFQLLAQ